MIIMLFLSFLCQICKLYCNLILFKHDAMLNCISPLQLYKSTTACLYLCTCLSLSLFLSFSLSLSVPVACLYIYIIYIAYFRRAAACTLACSMHTWFPSAAQDFGTVAFGEPRFGLWESVALFGLHGLLSLTFRDSGHTHLPCASLDDDPAFRARQVRIGIHVVIIVINKPPIWEWFIHVYTTYLWWFGG